MPQKNNNYNRDDNEISLQMRQAAVLGITLLVILLTALLVYIFTREPRPEPVESDTVSSEGPTGSPAASQPESATEIEIEIEPPETIPEPESEIPEPVTAEIDTGSTVEISVSLSDEELELEYPDTVLGVTADAGSEYLKSITFLGDSTTYGLKYYAVLDGGKQTTQVWTPVSGTLTLSQASFVKIYYPETDTEILIKEAAGLKKPQYMVITLGVNGVSFMTEDEFVRDYKSLIESILEASPDTKIILQSIFPVAKSYQNQDSINNEKINAANQWIVRLAKETGLKYLNTASVLKDEDGYLPEKYQNGDGLHLNEISAAIVTDYIRRHAYPVLFD